MTQPALPSGGGSYIIDEDGALVAVERPVAAFERTTDAPVAEGVAPATDAAITDIPKRKTAPRPDVQPDLKEV